MKVKCDECTKEFSVVKIKSKKVGQYRGNNVRFNYFDCPKCKHKYFMSARHKELNQMIARLKKMQKQIRLMKDHDEIHEIQREMKVLQSEIKAYNDLLRDLFVLK